jgi:hypothetical protein
MVAAASVCGSAFLPVAVLALRELALRDDPFVDFRPFPVRAMDRN